MLSIRPRRRMAALAVTGALLTAMAIFSAPAEASAGQCTDGTSNGNTRTCIYYDGTNNYVNYMKTSAYIYPSGQGRVLQTCLHDPSNARVACSTPKYVAPGQETSITPIQGGYYVQPGNWCALTWRTNSDNSTTLIGTACVYLKPSS